MEPISFNASLYRLTKYQEGNCKITFEIPASDMFKVQEIPIEKGLTVKVELTKTWSEPKVDWTHPVSTNPRLPT